MRKKNCTFFSSVCLVYILSLIVIRGVYMWNCWNVSPGAKRSTINRECEGHFGQTGNERLAIHMSQSEADLQIRLFQLFLGITIGINDVTNYQFPYSLFIFMPPHSLSLSPSSTIIVASSQTLVQFFLQETFQTTISVLNFSSRKKNIIMHGNYYGKFSCKEKNYQENVWIIFTKRKYCWILFELIFGWRKHWLNF